MNMSAAKVAGIFNVPAAAAPELTREVLLGHSGLVIADGKLQVMTWGFPRQEVSGRTGKPLRPRPVHNARADKLRVFSMWKDSFRDRRCLIPVSAWAQAEGERGHRTQTWYSLDGEELFAVAGIWRPTEDWGDAYTMIMVDSCPPASAERTQMPVILRQQDWSQWTDGKLHEALQLCEPYADLLLIDRTPQPWFKPRARRARPATRSKRLSEQPA